MTTTYDPRDPCYLDQADVRTELTRVFDVCHGCRSCVDRCASFPTLFDMIDHLAEPDAGLLTPSQQDEVVDGCFQCTLCAVDCPYTPERHEASVDVPRLMLRARAMHHANGVQSARDKRSARVMGRTDLIGRIATATSSLSNGFVGAKAGTVRRKVLARIAGVSAIRLLPTFAAERFSTWFATRPTVRLTRPHGAVTVFPTCLVEYQQPAIGKDLVRVYERNGIECAISDAGCCGAPSLHAGDVAEFTRIAEQNSATLAAAVRRGTDIVVPQPTCSYVIAHEYVRHVRDPAVHADAELVAAHTYDAAEYLMRMHEADDTTIDTDFAGETVPSVAYHVPDHLRRHDIGFPGRDLMKLTGADVTLVPQSAGVASIWGLRAGNEHVSVPIAERLGDRIEESGGEVVAGDCHLANTVIVEQTGRVVRHPLQIVARAYGVADTGDDDPEPRA